ncbi:hypothetical protein Y1Q_0015861 [Alligator mississippiensis]|uniref:Uncharacterized protein n=1 Tax=Alligator mississippiensis TaxID=8496 RepID=A0A151MH73_ALLMI|nr:hypothetical protein Y1Q_0015861 [Alligator mississippiensis]
MQWLLHPQTPEATTYAPDSGLPSFLLHFTTMGTTTWPRYLTIALLKLATSTSLHYISHLFSMSKVTTGETTLEKRNKKKKREP